MSAFCLGVAVIPIGVPVDVSLPLVHALKGTLILHDVLRLPSRFLSDIVVTTETVVMQDSPFIFLLTCQQDPRENILYEIRHGCFVVITLAPDYSNAYVYTRSTPHFGFVFHCASPSPATPGESSLEWRKIQVGGSLNADVQIALLKERMDELERMIRFSPGGAIFREAAQRFNTTAAKMGERGDIGDVDG